MAALGPVDSLDPWPVARRSPHGHSLVAGIRTTRLEIALLMLLALRLSSRGFTPRSIAIALEALRSNTAPRAVAIAILSRKRRASGAREED